MFAYKYFTRFIKSCLFFIGVGLQKKSAPTRDGYQFLGWATNDNATSAQYVQTGTTSFTMGTSNVMLYAVWQDVLIGADNYGDDADYNSANGVTDWKVFLNDGTNIYLIANDYVPRSKLSLTSDVEAGDGDYGVKGNSRDGLVNWLRTNSNWSNFANGTSGENSMSGAIVTGGPTLEQFVKSYNEKHGTSYTSNLGQAWWGLSNKTDQLYMPHTSSWNSMESYGMASNCSSNSAGVWDVICSGTVGNNTYSSMDRGVRPLVCLPSGVKATQGSDGKWKFAKY